MWIVYLEKRGKLTGRSNEAVVVLVGEERVREVTQEQLQQAGDAVDIVVEVLGVSEIESWV